MKIRNYDQAINFLYHQIPSFAKLGKKALRPTLKNITILCNALGNPQNKYKIIHIAGTNGKGTVSHIIAGILHSQGYKVGLHSSPHYVDFRERMKVDGKLPTKTFIKSFLNNNFDLIERIRPSFFEVGIAMSFYYFATQNVDYAVVEVGLGGKYDSTNIVNPILSIITNISKDHTNLLGSTVQEIAEKKAGIIKTTKPVLIGEYQKDCESLFRSKANLENCRLEYAKDLCTVTTKSEDLRYSKYYISCIDTTIKTNLKGPYNVQNLKTAFAAINMLNIGKINVDLLKKYFVYFTSKIKYLGRWQIINYRPLIILESAHNEAGFNYVSKFLNKTNFSSKHIVLGFSSDKVRDKIYPLLPKDATYYFVKVNSIRSLDSNTLSREGSRYGLLGKHYKNVLKGFTEAKKNALNDDLIFVCGSIFVVSEVLVNLSGKTIP